MLHSPGPWRFGGEFGNSQDEIEDADGRTIAVVWTRTATERATARPQFKDVPMFKANLALMIAAPEILAALHQIVIDYDTWERKPGEPDWEAITMARDALCRAIGMPEKEECPHYQDNQGFCHKCGIVMCEGTVRDSGYWQEGMVEGK